MQGYESCPTDPCVMRKVEDGTIYLLLIYVDDILVLANEKETERLRQAFIQEYQWITMEYGSVHSYLGIQIIFQDGHVRIDMTHFVDKLLQTYVLRKILNHRQFRIVLHVFRCFRIFDRSCRIILNLCLRF